MNISDKRIIIIFLIIIMITVSSTSIFFLLGGGVGTARLSEVNASRIYVTQPNSSAITNALDQLGCKNNQGVCSASSPKLLIGANIVLFDSNQQKHVSNTFINIPQDSIFTPKINTYTSSGQFIDAVPLIDKNKLSLIDSSGNNVDLGSIQIGLSAVTNTDTYVIVQGKFTAYLDDVVVGTKTLATQGNTVNKTLSLQINSQPAYTFTLADELKNAVDKSQHIFRVEISDVSATVGSGQTTQTYQLAQKSLVYILVMTVDQQKTTIIGVDQKAIAIFKSDDTIQLCARNAVIGVETLGSLYNHYDHVYVKTPLTDTGLVEIYENGFKIGSGQAKGIVPPYNTENSESIDTSASGASICSAIKNIPRDSDLIMKVNNMVINFHTPVTQVNMHYDCQSAYVACVRDFGN